MWSGDFYVAPVWIQKLNFDVSWSGGEQAIDKADWTVFLKLMKTTMDMPMSSGGHSKTGIITGVQVTTASPWDTGTENNLGKTNYRPGYVRIGGARRTVPSRILVPFALPQNVLSLFNQRCRGNSHAEKCYSICYLLFFAECVCSSQRY